MEQLSAARCRRHRTRRANRKSRTDARRPAFDGACVQRHKTRHTGRRFLWLGRCARRLQLVPDTRAKRNCHSAVLCAVTTPRMRDLVGTNMVALPVYRSRDATNKLRENMHYCKVWEREIGLQWSTFHRFIHLLLSVRYPGLRLGVACQTSVLCVID